jgi:hypothetical protein
MGSGDYVKRSTNERRQRQNVRRRYAGRQRPNQIWVDRATQHRRYNENAFPETVSWQLIRSGGNEGGRTKNVDKIPTKTC